MLITPWFLFRDSIVSTSFAFPQTELDTVSGVLNEVEGKSIKAAKDCSAVESQLQDVQVSKAVHSGQHCNRTENTLPRIEFNPIYLPENFEKSHFFV